MFQVPKRTVSLRPFFWVPTTYVLIEKWEKYFSGTHSYLEAWKRLFFKKFAEDNKKHKKILGMQKVFFTLHFCSAGTAFPSLCIPGHYCPLGQEPVPCPVTTYQDEYGTQWKMEDCKDCQKGYICNQTGKCTHPHPPTPHPPVGVIKTWRFVRTLYA